ncbi:MAG: TRAP transporter substrate-binding protein DctP [Pseudomonadota bacterium]
MKEKKQIRAMIKFCLVGVLMAIALGSLSAHAGSNASVITLKYGSYAPHNIIDDPILWYLDEVSKRSGVTIKTETYFAGTLAGPQDCLGAIGIGVYDIGWISPVFNPDKIPYAIIPNATPVVSVPLTTSLKAANEFTRTFQPAVQELEKANVKFLFHSGAWYYDLISTKSVRTYEDLKGLRVRTFGYLAKAWVELGGTAVSISIPEVYSSLQKGVLDAVLSQPVSMSKTLHLSDIAKHYTKIHFGCLSVPVIMNMKTWNRLPEQVRQTMTDIAKEMPAIADEIISKAELDAIVTMEKEGISINELPPSDMALNRDASNKVIQIIVSDLSAKGASSAGEAMDIYLKAIDTFSK